MLILFALATTPLSAQTSNSADGTPAWVGHFSVLAANMLLGGVTAGVGRLLGGGRFDEAFASGSVGGAAVFAGKEFASQHFYGAGLIGREVAAVGSSIVSNTSQGATLLGTVYLPVGPFPFQAELTTSGPPHLAMRVKVTDLGYTIWGLAHPHLALQVNESFSYGAPVFRAQGRLIRNDDVNLGGSAGGGVIVIGDPLLSDQSGDRPRTIGAHERVHVLQLDFLSITWNRPVSELLIVRLPFGETFNRFATLDLITGFPIAAEQWLWSERDKRPHEMEATFLSR